MNTEFDGDIVEASSRRANRYVSLPPQLVDMIDDEANRRTLGRRKLVELILRQWLKDQGAYVEPGIS